MLVRLLQRAGRSGIIFLSGNIEGCKKNFQKLSQKKKNLPSANDGQKSTNPKKIVCGKIWQIDEYTIRSTDNEEIARQKEKNFEALYGEQHYTLDGNVYKNLPDTIVVPSKEQKGTTDDGDKKSLGKTVALETFKAEEDRPVTLFNLQTGNKISLLKTGVFAPLGLAYDMYQDFHQYSGTNLAKVTLLNAGGFAASFAIDTLLVTSDGVLIEATIPANIAIAEGINSLKKELAKTDAEKEQKNQ